MATTTNVDRMTRTAREITEAQRDSWEAITENLTAARRRGVGLAQDGMEFLRLQEQNAKAAEQWFDTGMKIAELQQRNARFAQNWLREGAEALQEQNEHNLRTAEAFVRSARKQQEGFRVFAQGWTEAYEGFFPSPFYFAREGLRILQQTTEQSLKTSKQVVEQGAGASEHVTRQGLRVAEEATHEAELRTSVLSSLQADKYEGLTVAEVTEKLDDLSIEELKALRELEKRNKDRESLVERIDSKIRANS